MPKWSTSFEPRCASETCTFGTTIDTMFKRFPSAGPAAQAYLSFMRSARDSFPENAKSIPWRETRNSLQQFVSEMANTPDSVVQFSMTVDRNAPLTTPDNPWGLKV